MQTPEGFSDKRQPVLGNPWNTTIYDGHGCLSRCSETQTSHRSTVYDRVSLPGK